MNAAEKAAQAKNREKQARAVKMFEEAQAYRKECFSVYFYDSCTYKTDCFSFYYYDEDGEVRYSWRESAYKKALKLFTKCAKEGHVESMDALGELYMHGKRGDEKKSALWFEKAAEYGSINGMCGIIRCYKEGYGVPKSSDMVTKWTLRLKSTMNGMFEDALNKYNECKKNFATYANGRNPDAAKLNSEDMQLISDAINILIKCAVCRHLKSMEVLEEIYDKWMHDRDQFLYWTKEKHKAKRNNNYY